MILPGVTISIPFFFKSPNSGIFTETWHLETQPLLCAGAKIEVVLRGISTETDRYENERNKIEVILIFFIWSINRIFILLSFCLIYILSQIFIFSCAISLLVTRLCFSHEWVMILGFFSSKQGHLVSWKLHSILAFLSLLNPIWTGLFWCW